MNSNLSRKLSKDSLLWLYFMQNFAKNWVALHNFEYTIIEDQEYTHNYCSEEYPNLWIDV